MNTRGARWAIVTFLTRLRTNLPHIGTGNTQPRTALTRRFARFTKTQRQGATLRCRNTQLLGHAQRSGQGGIDDRSTGHGCIFRWAIIVVLARPGAEPDVAQWLITCESIVAVRVRLAGAAIVAIGFTNARQRRAIKIQRRIPKLFAIKPSRTNRLAKVIATRGTKANTARIG